MTFVEVQSGTGYSASNTVPALTTVASGDVLLAFAGGNSTNDPVTPPDGSWTFLATGTWKRIHVYTKTATGALGSTVWGWPGTQWHNVVIAAYRDVAAPTTATVAAGGTGGTTTIDAPSQTAVSSGATLVCHGFINQGGTTTLTFSGSMTARGSRTGVPGYLLADEALVSSGATGTRTLTDSPGGGISAASLVLEPVGGAGPDTTPPSISLADPTPAGQTAGFESVTGTVTLTATATDDTAMDRVEFYVDAVLIGTDSTGVSDTYTADWDTTTPPEGPRVLTAIAYDAAGNSTTSDPVTVNVNNGGRWANGNAATVVGSFTAAATGEAAPVGTPFGAALVLDGSTASSVIDWQMYQRTSSKRNRYPQTNYEPFPSSIWNTPVGSSPTLAASSATQIAALLALQAYPDDLALATPEPYDYTRPIYYADRDDPQVTIHSTEYPSDSVEGITIRIPALAKAPNFSNADAHIVIVDEHEGYEYDFWHVPDGQDYDSGVFNVGTGVKLPLSGPAHAWYETWGTATQAQADAGTTVGGDKAYGSAVVAGFAASQGQIRMPDLAAGRIPHALFMVISAAAPGFVFPAMNAGAVGSSSLPKMGAHLWLDMSDADINALSIQDYQKTVLRALHEFGAYTGDTGAWHWIFRMESSLSYTAYGRTDPQVTFAAANGLYTDSSGSYAPWSNVPSTVWQNLKVIAPAGP